jgi:hypothetical protein
MQTLDRLDTALATSLIVKRFHLVRLVESRMQLEENHRPRQTRALRNADRAVEQGAHARAATQALNDMMAETYPDLKRGTEEYARRLTTLKNRLSKGRNWHILVKRFGTGILALVPTDGDFNVHDRE